MWQKNYCTLRCETTFLGLMVIGSLQKGGRFLANPRSSGKSHQWFKKGTTLSGFSLVMQCFLTSSSKCAVNVSVRRATSNPRQVYQAVVH